MNRQGAKMTDKEVLMLAYGGLKASCDRHSKNVGVEDLILIIEKHLGYDPNKNEEEQE